MPILTDIPFDLDAQPLLKRAHLAPDSADAADFERLVQTARAVGRPKAGYREAFIDAKGDQTVTIEGITFTSRMLRKNLEHAERVFAFLVTCGREVDQAAPRGDDMLTEFWWDLIKGELLNVARQYLAEHLDRKHLLPQTSAMHPGSGDVAVWPIEQQRELFTLLGDVPDRLGVELTDTYLMIPNKTRGSRHPFELTQHVGGGGLVVEARHFVDQVLQSLGQEVGDFAVVLQQQIADLVDSVILNVDVQRHGENPPRTTHKTDRGGPRSPFRRGQKPAPNGSSAFFGDPRRAVLSAG